MINDSISCYVCAHWRRRNKFNPETLSLANLKAAENRKTHIETTQSYTKFIMTEKREDSKMWKEMYFCCAKNLHLSVF